MLKNIRSFWIYEGDNFENLMLTFVVWECIAFKSNFSKNIRWMWSSQCDHYTKECSANEWTYHEHMNIDVTKLFSEWKRWENIKMRIKNPTEMNDWLNKPAKYHILFIR